MDSIIRVDMYSSACDEKTEKTVGASELRDSELYALIDECMPGNLVVLSPERHLPCLHANPSFLSLLGYNSFGAFLLETGGLFRNCLYGSDVDKFFSFAMSCRYSDKTEGAPATECRLLREDGGYIWTRITAKAHGRSSANIVCLIEDMAERKAAKKELEDAIRSLSVENKRLGAVLNNVPVGIYTFQLSEPIRIVRSNDALCAMTGYSRSEMKDLFDDDYRLMICESDREVYTDALKSLSDHPCSRTIGYRIRKKDGQTVGITDSLKSARDFYGRMWACAVITGGDPGSRCVDACAKMAGRVAQPIVGVTCVGETVSLDFANILFRALPVASLGAFGANPSVGSSTSADEGVLRHVRQKLKPLIDGQDFVEEEVVGQGRRLGGISGVSASVYFRQGGTVCVAIVFETEELKLMEQRAADCVLRTGGCAWHDVQVTTFGYFDIRVDGHPISFRSAKAKELLAFLIDRRGAFASAADIIAALWENEPVNKVTRARLRKTMMRLVNELSVCGIEYIVESSPKGERRIVPERVRCDLFDFLSDEDSRADSFRGAYMSDYSWGEFTLAQLMRSTPDVVSVDERPAVGCQWTKSHARNGSGSSGNGSF